MNMSATNNNESRNSPGAAACIPALKGKAFSCNRHAPIKTIDQKQDLRLNTPENINDLL
jgi:hypothetical protein